MATVGFVGLGSMGLPMARNLVTRGFAVRGFDLRASAMDALVSKPGANAPRPAAEAGKRRRYLDCWSSTRRKPSRCCLRTVRSTPWHPAASSS